MNMYNGWDATETAVGLRLERDGVVLWRGDCLEVLPLLTRPFCDAVATDPPYGIDYGRQGSFSATHGWSNWREQVEWDVERPDGRIFDSIASLGVPSVVWGGNYFTDYLPPRMGWILWDKGQRDFSLADFEMAWTSETKAARCIDYPRAHANREQKFHPTQKPVAVMQQCIDYLQRGNKKNLKVIFDPFMGAGSTGVAAIRMDRSFIGIERDSGYFDSAVRRLTEALLAEKSSLFPAKSTVTQVPLFTETD